jgi:GTP cyclohydrolase I
MTDRDDPIADAVGQILGELGEDPLRDGLQKTPSRVAEALRFFTSGYQSDPKELLKGALFDVDYDEMVLVRDIDFYSLCEHHMVPFFGRVHVAYIPKGKVVGLSKIARLVEVYARRLQVQERFSMEVAGALEEVLRPKGVGVVVEARHLCMVMRGVQKQNTWVITSSLRGCFESNSKTRTEFMELIQHQTDSFA